MARQLKLLLFTFSLCSWTVPVWADYTLVLKNGRRITVQSYREEGRMIKFRGLGGDIGISRDQIQSIQKADPGEPTLDQTQLQESAVATQVPERPLIAEEEKAKEEKEYQQKLLELTRSAKRGQRSLFRVASWNDKPGAKPVSHRGTDQGESGGRHLALSGCNVQSQRTRTGEVTDTVAF